MNASAPSPMHHRVTPTSHRLRDQFAAEVLPRTPSSHLLRLQRIDRTEIQIASQNNRELGTLMLSERRSDIDGLIEYACGHVVALRLRVLVDNRAVAIAPARGQITDRIVT